MPVILTTQDEIDAWMDAPAPIALKLQRPLPDNALMVVARGRRRMAGRRNQDPVCFCEVSSLLHDQELSHFSLLIHLDQDHLRRHRSCQQ
jgi:hypothetical protein